MNMNIAITNGHVFSPADGFDRQTDIYISNGHIAAVGDAPTDFVAEKTIAADSLLVIPGVIDISVHLPTIATTAGADFADELIVAAKAGVTTVCVAPDFQPVIDKPAVVESLLLHKSEDNRAALRCIGALTRGLQGESLSEMYALQAAGCVAVGNADTSFRESVVLRRCMEYARSCNLPVFLFAEDDSLRNQGVVHEGEVSTRLGLPPIAETAETVAVARALLLAEDTGVRLHLCRLSTACAVKMVADAQQRGLAVTADVDICHLFLTDKDVAGFNSLCHLRPPLRSPADRDALLQGLTDGVISVVCSDHRPLKMDTKMRPFALTEPGAATIELLLPLLLHLVAEGKLDKATAISAVTSAAAEVTAIPAGTLAPGKVADISVVDMNCDWEVTTENLHSIGSNCPFIGWNLSARACAVICRGVPLDMEN